jgi:hypothetical protein
MIFDRSNYGCCVLVCGLLSCFVSVLRGNSKTYAKISHNLEI